ncbi:hypothetical protein GCM10009547_20650 [Sporichthya brevicatena]|uniref:Septum formation-related domain-containing protein n=1 Tax=Sporichthya brevicatena TaxID=171442 RepID=A0ABN1GSI8_9ACTN
MHLCTSRTLRSAAASAALALTLTLTACGDDDDPSPVTQSSTTPSAAASADATPAGDHPLVGTCYTASTADGPVRTSKVDCSAPHSAEVFAVIPNSAEVSTDRAAFQDAKSAERQAWELWSAKVCGLAFLEATGTTAWAKAIGLDPATQWVRPTSWAGTMTPSLSTADEWAAGERLTLCTARTQDAVAGISADDPKAPQVPGTWVRKIGAGSLPSALGACALYAERGRPMEPAGCTDPHYVEYAFDFDAADLFDEAFITALDPKQLKSAEWDALIAVCEKAEAAVIGRERDEVKLFPLVTVDTWNQTVGGKPLHTVSCVAQAEDQQTYDLASSVIGVGSRDIKLVEGS